MTNHTDIMLATIAHFKIPIEALLGQMRDPQVIIARHVAWSLERKRGLSYPQIGALYKRDSSSVVVACNHMTERLAVGDKRYVPAIDAIEMTLSRQGSVVVHCPTCGTSVVELRRQIEMIHKRLTELGVKP